MKKSLISRRQEEMEQFLWRGVNLLCMRISVMKKMSMKM